jgi:hypothetical protein
MKAQKLYVIILPPHDGGVNTFLHNLEAVRSYCLPKQVS